MIVWPWLPEPQERVRRAGELQGHSRSAKAPPPGATLDAAKKGRHGQQGKAANQNWRFGCVRNAFALEIFDL